MPKIVFTNYRKRIFILSFESKELGRKNERKIETNRRFDFSPLASVDPLHSNMNALYVELIDDSLTELVYPAEIGGLKYELISLNYGIQVWVDHRRNQIESKTFLVEYSRV